LNEVKQSSTFYFDKLCQLKMPCWMKGRIALVSGTGYCASPAAGRGGPGQTLSRNTTIMNKL